MKAVLCSTCLDIVVLYPTNPRTCKCGVTGGYEIDRPDGHAVYWGDCSTPLSIPIGELCCVIRDFHEGYASRTTGRICIQDLRLMRRIPNPNLPTGVDYKVLRAFGSVGGGPSFCYDEIVVLAGGTDVLDALKILRDQGFVDSVMPVVENPKLRWFLTPPGYALIRELGWCATLGIANAEGIEHWGCPWCRDGNLLTNHDNFCLHCTRTIEGKYVREDLRPAKVTA